jgi:DNA polymerase I-like protein with 3'-5' exonuclease and polymerase domains
MMAGNYHVIDLETSIKNRGEEAIGKFKASPFHHENDIVMYGEISDEYPHSVLSTSWPLTPPENCELLVGHNIGFDLLYLLREDNWMQWLKEGGKIWDTMIVEYLLSGQEHKFPSLDFCSEKYGGTIKNDAIKEYWNNDIDTEDIPREELKEYLENDVINTELVFANQLERVTELQLSKFIDSQMEARLATILMEFNGMYFNKEKAKKRGDEIRVEVEDLVRRLSHDMNLVFPAPFKWTAESPKQLSTFLFGGDIAYSNDELVVDEDGEPVVYKSGKRKGQIKTKKVKKTEHYEGLLDGDSYSEKGKSGVYGTGDAVIKKILKEASISSKVKDILMDTLQLRELKKDLTAYYDGYSDITWPNGIIHPSFNHAQTSTGRLSCSNPNLQQVTKK